MFLSKFSEIVELSKRFVLQSFDRNFIFKIISVILYLQIINFLFIIICEIFINIIMNISVYHNLTTIILVSSILILQTLTLLNLIMNKTIIISKFQETIVNCRRYLKYLVRLYIYPQCKYEITTTLRPNQMFFMFDEQLVNISDGNFVHIDRIIVQLPSDIIKYILSSDMYIYIDQINKYLKVDKNVNIVNFDNRIYYNIEYNGLYVINKITNYTIKYKQILNKIFPRVLTDEILKFV